VLKVAIVYRCQGCFICHQKLRVVEGQKKRTHFVTEVTVPPRPLS